MLAIELTSAIDARAAVHIAAAASRAFIALELTYRWCEMMKGRNEHHFLHLERDNVCRDAKGS